MNQILLFLPPPHTVLQGSVLDGAALLELVEGLKQNWLLNYDYLITGYIGVSIYVFYRCRYSQSKRRYRMLAARFRVVPRGRDPGAGCRS